MSPILLSALKLGSACCVCVCVCCCACLAATTGAQWEKARKVFEQMQGNGCQPDVVTYTALISSYERGGQWLLALEAFEEMVARGCWPDAIVYNAIIDALWQTGVVWAQVGFNQGTGSVQQHA